MCSPATLKDDRFAGKKIVITGGGGAFGTEGAAYFCAQGTNVVLIDSSQRSLDSAVEKAFKAMMLESAQDADKTAHGKGVGAQITNLSVCQCDVQDEFMVSCGPSNFAQLYPFFEEIVCVLIIGEASIRICAIEIWPSRLSLEQRRRSRSSQANP